MLDTVVEPLTVADTEREAEKLMLTVTELLEDGVAV